MLLICERYILSFTLRFFQGEEGDFYGHIILLPCYISDTINARLLQLSFCILYTCTNADKYYYSKANAFFASHLTPTFEEFVFVYAPLPFDTNKMLLLLKLKMACLDLKKSTVTYFLVSNWLEIGRVNG